MVLAEVMFTMTGADGVDDGLGVVATVAVVSWEAEVVVVVVVVLAAAYTQKKQKGKFPSSVTILQKKTRQWVRECWLENAVKNS
jgi:hypothetical protein